MAQPILFKLYTAVTTKGAFGVAPLKPSPRPQSWNTPFGITGSNIKGPGIPKPILFLVSGLKLTKGGVFHPLSPMLGQGGSGGATAWTQTLADAFTLAEAQTKALSWHGADAYTLADALSKALQRQAADLS